MDVCQKCGLPKDLCVCESIAREQQKIVISDVKRKYKKHVTIIEGLDEKQIDVKGLTKLFKQKLACGGTAKEGMIELQGQHAKKAKEILVKEGFPEESIEVK
ncbi:MAG: stress response translation initiation inhibitor YciH [Nanoarchaeota archaeon]|nr:stress response translation initiation inhibitor YciH [Nanoarchaeota archaeon]